SETAWAIGVTCATAHYRGIGGGGALDQREPPPPPGIACHPLRQPGGRSASGVVEKRPLALPRQAFELPLGARGRRAVRVRLPSDQPERTATARVTRACAGSMRAQPCLEIVADAGIPAAVPAFDQVQPPCRAARTHRRSMRA